MLNYKQLHTTTNNATSTSKVLHTPLKMLTKQPYLWNSKLSRGGRIFWKPRNDKNDSRNKIHAATDANRNDAIISAPAQALAPFWPDREPGRTILSMIIL